MRHFPRLFSQFRLTAVFATLSVIAVMPPSQAADSTSSKAGKELVLGDPALTAGLPGTGPITDAELTTWLANPQVHKAIEVKLPMGLEAASANVFVPENNPITLAKIELGRQLYFDPRLSADSSVSCASCHDPNQGYGAATRFGVGIRGLEGGRNSPVSYNRILSKEQFWDGRAATLEDQAVGPIANSIEMGNTHEACVACLAGIPGYKKQFEAIFEDGLNINNVGKALATFERVLVTGPTPYDYLVELQSFEKAYSADIEDIDALKEDDPELYEQYQQLRASTKSHPMTESAKRGMTLFFGKANCTACHAGANFTDEQYHNLGVGMDAKEPDLGRYVITKTEKEKGAFKTPTCRNVALSPPYMHDGSQATLEEVVEWYNVGGHKNPWLSDKMKPLGLNDQEKKDLVAFLREGLTGDFPIVESKQLPK